MLPRRSRECGAVGGGVWSVEKRRNFGYIELFMIFGQ